MPPPVLDPWLSARRFGIVIDAGSSGSRLQIYSWKDPRTALLEGGEAVHHSLPKVEKGTRDSEEWVTKVEPGLSTFGDNPDGVASYLAPLLEHARNQIPPSLHAETPLFLLATAGMRLLTSSQQREVLHSTCQFLRLHSHFRIDKPSSVGPCGSSVRIITGEEEGLFGWIAVNYLMDGFTASNEDRTTYGFLDMGGASTQIAFEPSKSEREKNPQNLKDVRLRLLGGQDIEHQVFVTTWLGYGTNQARERYVGHAVDEFDADRSINSPYGSSTANELIPDPCLPKDLQLTEHPTHLGTSAPDSKEPHTLVGTGSFEQCLKKTSPLLNKDAPCPDSPCLFDGVHVPPIDFSASHFIGVSEYWYSSEHVFGLGGAYDFVQYERAASEFCSRPWSDIVHEHEVSRRQGQSHLGGDGEVEQDGRIVSAGKWGDKVEISRLQMQCFKAAWVANVLHEGIGLPRIVDVGGNSTTDAEKVTEQAERKGLGRPAFQSLDTVGDIAISWTLGKMVLEASKEVTPLSIVNEPLLDPMEDKPIHYPSTSITGPPPLFDFGSIEDRISNHLPSSLMRESLGFSLLGLIFYAVFFFSVIFVIYRLRHQIRVCLRRTKRGVSRREREDYLMEEGKPLNGISSPIQSRFPRGLLHRLRRLISRQRPRSLNGSPLGHFQRPSHFQGLSSPSRRASPIMRSNSLPNQYSYPNGTTAHGGNTTQFTSRPSSPGPSFVDDNGPMANSVPSLSSITARSRNSSQMNLSTLVPRQVPLSRTNSVLQIPNGGPFHHEDEYE